MRTGHFKQFGDEDTIAGHDLDVQSERFGLLRGQSEILEGVGVNDQQVGAGVLDLRQLGAEFGVTLGVAFLGHNFAAQFNEVILEELVQTDGVRRGNIGQEGGLAQSQFVVGEVSLGVALIRVNEADAEHVGVQFAIFRIR